MERLGQDVMSAADLKASDKIFDIERNANMQMTANANHPYYAQKRAAGGMTGPFQREGHETTVHEGGVWDSASTHRLITAVHEYGRNWKLVAEYVGGGKTVKQCQHKIGHLVRVKILEEPPNKRIRRIQEWDQESNEKLRVAVLKHGRDWEAVAAEVSDGVFDHEQCRKRADALIKSGVLPKPPLKQIQVSWDREATERLRVAIEKYGRSDWSSVAEFVGGGKSIKQCKYKCDHLTKIGILRKP